MEKKVLTIFVLILVMLAVAVGMFFAMQGSWELAMLDSDLQILLEAVVVVCLFTELALGFAIFKLLIDINFLEYPK